MDNHNKFDERLAKIERYLLRLVIFVLFLLALKRFFLSEVRASTEQFKNRPAVTRCIHQTEEPAMTDLDGDSTVPMCNGTGGHGPSRSTASPPRRHGKAPPVRSCSNQACCRAGK
jgi:hypothetical protein